MQPSDAGKWLPIGLDRETGLITLRSVDGVVAIEAACTLEANGRTCRLGDSGGPLVSAQTDPGAGLRYDVDLPEQVTCSLLLSLSEDSRTVLISLSIENEGSAPVRLGRCTLLHVGEGVGGVTLAGDDGEAVYLACTGTTSHTTVRRAAEDGEPCMSRSLLHIVGHGAGRALHLGFTNLGGQTTFGTFTYGPRGIGSLDAVCDFEGFELPPGARVSAGPLMVEALPDLHASLHHWADRVAQTHRPTIWPKTPGGWLGWAWVDAFNSERYEDVMIRNCEAIRRRLPGVDIEYVWVSIGNIKDGMPGNWLQWDTDTFPHGHEWLVQRLGEMGYKLGLWCGTFWLTSCLSELWDEMEDAMLTKDGKPVVALPEWKYGAAGRMKREDRPWITALDPTHPKTKAFLTEVFETYRQWGVRYYMIDFLHAISGSTPGDILYDGYHDKTVVKGPELLRTGLRIVREAAGPETYLLSSSGPTFQNVGFMDACRVGNDYGEGRAINPESYFYPATFVINSAGFWTSHRHASDNMAAAYFTHRKLYVNDSGNVMTVDKPIPVCEAQIAATIFGLSGGPVMLGDDIDRIAEERLALIRKVFPRTPEIATPVDLFDRPAPDYPRVFHQHVTADWGEWDVVGVLNYEDDPLVLPIALDRLGLGGGQYRLWELWNEQYLGTITGELRAVVPPRSARLYRLAAAGEAPAVLSTDMHVLQGKVELSEVRWDEETMTLSGTATRPPGEVGSLYLIAPRGFRVRDPRRLWVAKDAAEQVLIVRLQLAFGDEPVQWRVGFAPLDAPFDQETMDLA